MARIDYSYQTTDLEGTARGRINEAPISPKAAIEIARFIRGKELDYAEVYLKDVVALKRAIPYKRFNRNVPHRKGLTGWDAGRFPQKASKVYLRLINNVRKNAEYVGLETKGLKIVCVTANRGIKRKGFMPRAMGRATPKNRELVNIEIFVREKEA